MLRRLSIISGLLALCVVGARAETYTPEEASSHIGQRGTVCGVVASATHAVRVKGEPTFLNLGKPYPNQVFTAVIWGSDRSKFGTPEISLKGVQVCVTGEIRLYGGKAEIILSDPGQLIKK
jgi:hypothetical protein